LSQKKTEDWTGSAQSLNIEPTEKTRSTVENDCPGSDNGHHLLFNNPTETCQPSDQLLGALSAGCLFETIDPIEQVLNFLIRGWPLEDLMSLAGQGTDRTGENNSIVRRNF
jgi:hypothetical protein